MYRTSLHLLFGDVKELPSSILFSSRIRLTVRSEKPVASSVFLHHLGGVEFYFLLCQSKWSCKLQVILLEVLLSRFPFGISILTTDPSR